MTERPATCKPSDTLAAAVTTMWQRDIGFLPVVDDAGKAVAVITDRDACIAACTRGSRMDEIEVRTVMSKEVWTCAENDGVEDALALLRARKIRRAPVVGGDGTLVGVITINDLAHAIVDAPEANPAAASEMLATLLEITEPRTPREATN